MTNLKTTLDTSRVYTPSSQTLVLASSIMLALFVWMFWSFLERQVRFAVEYQADWGHTLVIPFIAGWFVWLNRDRILANPFKPSVTGLVLVLFGLLWFSLAAIGPSIMRHHNLMGMGVGIVIFGLILAMCGWRAMRWLWFPVVYLVIFSQTISDRFLDLVTFELQGIATVGGEIGLGLIGYDVAREGHTITIFYDERIVPINIAEACSGMRMLVAFLALGVAMAYRGLDTWWQRVILVLMAFPTAIFVNILRVMTLGILATFDSNLAAGDFHSMIGLLWLVPAFFIYLGIMWVMRHLLLESDENDDESPPSAPIAMRFDGKIIGVFIFAACIVVLGVSKVALTQGADLLNVYLKTEAVPLRRSLSLIPSAVGPWRSVRDVRFDAAMVEQLGTPMYLTRTYVDSDGNHAEAMQLHIAYYTDQIDAIPHVPDNCLTAAGLSPRTPDPSNVPVVGLYESWTEDPDHQLDDTPYPIATVHDSLLDTDVDVRMPTGEPLVRYMEFVDPSHPDRRLHAGYFFVANGRWKPSPAGVKMAAFSGGDQYSYYCKVQVIAEGDSGYDQVAFFAGLEPFLSNVLPEVMRSIADWTEVTATTDSNQSE
jgi:exosortase